MRQFSADHYFHIGSAHYHAGKPCQDYALSGTSVSSAIAIVSDGCSTGRHTDIGSRIQALTLLGAVRNIREEYKTVLPGLTSRIREENERLVHEAEILLGLSPVDMLATSLYAYLSSDGGFAHVQGDGVVARKYKDGRIVANRYEWLDNMPFYPSYRGLDLAEFVARHGGDLDGLRFSRTRALLDAGGNVQSEEVTKFTLREGLSGIGEIICSNELEETDFLAVFTDGVAQIEEVDWKKAVFDLMSFKSFEGEFVKRRVIRGLKDYEREGRKAVDDISMAAVRVQHSN